MEIEMEGVAVSHSPTRPSASQRKANDDAHNNTGHKPEPKPKRNQFHGLIGLVNTGNSCYMNSSLQSLSNCEPFRRYFIECLPPQSTSNLSSSLSLLYQKMWTSERNPGNLSPRTVSSSMKQKIFRGWQQQDAQEFLRCLFNQLHDELSMTLPFCSDSLTNEACSSYTSQESVGSSNGSTTELINKGSKSSSLSSGEHQTSIKPKLSPSMILYSKVSEHLNKGKKTQLENGHDTADDHCDGNVSQEEEEEEEEVVVIPKNGVVTVDLLTGQATIQQATMADSEKDGSSNATMEKSHTKSSQSVSIITELFQGKFESRVKCLQCSKVSVTQEPFQDLSLPIPSRKELTKLRKPTESDEESDIPQTFSNKVCHVFNVVVGYTRDMVTGPPTSLEDCLEGFFDSSDLSGDNRYLCQRCNSFQNSKKDMSIIEAPEVLCIHLKRFRYDAFFMSKISRHIQFPLNNLNLSSYMKSKDQSSCNYRLFSVIVHIGGAGGGHYISYGRGSGDSEDWYEFNDTRVNRISVDDVLSSEGYVLFYQRCSNQQINPINIPDIVPHPDTCIPSPDVCYISRHWLVLRNTCHRPGPVIPYEFGCEHGGVYPGRERLSKTLAIPIRRDIYEQLQQKHGGGGPLISSLDTCESCKKLILELNERRKFESDKVTEIQNDDKTSSANLLLSKLWLKQWQDFVRCDSLEVKPPGPIDNSVLLMASQDSSGIMMNKVNHYRTITLSIWEYLHGIYGGGPAVMVASKTT